MNLKKAAIVLKAMVNVKRLEILLYLSHNEMSVSVLQQKIGISQSVLSQHLAVLRLADIVQTRREKQKIFYGVQNELIKRLLKTLTKG